MFTCFVKYNVDINKLNEFEEYAWVKPKQLTNYDLNEATKLTFKQKKLIG